MEALYQSVTRRGNFIRWNSPALYAPRSLGPQDPRFTSHSRYHRRGILPPTAHLGNYHSWPPRVPTDFRPNHVLFLQCDTRAGPVVLWTEFLLYMRWLFSSVAHQITRGSSSSLCVWENYFKISILILAGAIDTSLKENSVHSCVIARSL